MVQFDSPQPSFRGGRQARRGPSLGQSEGPHPLPFPFATLRVRVGVRNDGKLHQYRRAVKPPLLLLSGFLAASILAGEPAAAPRKIKLSPQSVAPGETLSVSVLSKGALEGLACRFEGRDAPAYEVSPGRWRALVGIPAGTPPGSRELEISSPAMGKQKLAVTVKSKAFGSERLSFSPKKKKLLGLPTNREEVREIRQALSGETPAKLWRGRFRVPVRGPVSTPYGVKRTHQSDFHRGVDIKCDTGTPVLAPESGRVVLVKTYSLHGNTVVLDHGQGVMTIYLHLSEFSAKTGHALKAGQVLGRAGDTGLATAPHLHWGLYVHGVPVDPLLWTKRRF